MLIGSRLLVTPSPVDCGCDGVIIVEPSICGTDHMAHKASTVYHLAPFRKFADSCSSSAFCLLAFSLFIFIGV